MEGWRRRPGRASPTTPQTIPPSAHASHSSTSVPSSGPQNNGKVSFRSKCKTMVGGGSILRIRRTPKATGHSLNTMPPPSSTYSANPASQTIATLPPASKLKARVTQCMGRASDTGDDVVFTALQVLRDSSDAFPPLKSAVGGVLALWQTAKTIKSLREDAQLFSAHVLRLESSLKDVLSDTDPTTLPADLVLSVDAITSLLLECTQELSKDTKRSSFNRLIALNRTKDTWASFRVRFSRECERFSMQAAATTVARIARLQEQNARLQGDMDDVKNRVVLIHEWTTQTSHFKTAYVCFF